MKSILRLVFIAGSLFCLTVSGIGQSTGGTDVIFRAMQDEMARSSKRLTFKTFDKPYFLEYVVDETDSLMVRSSYGALNSSSRNKSKTLTTAVRVGGYALDSGEVKFPFRLPLDDDYDSIRRAAWLATDYSYKQAVNSFERIKDAGKKTAEREGEPEDENGETKKAGAFTKEKPAIEVGGRSELVVDKEKWETQVKKWSAIFKKFPEFRRGNVNFYARRFNRYLINSEGSKILSTRLLLTIDIHAEAITKDRVVLTPYRHYYATDFDELPSVETIDRVIMGIRDEVATFENAAEFKDRYIGPAIYTGGASVSLFLAELASQFGGDSSDSAAAKRAFGDDSIDTLGRKILPSFMTVVDDPTLKTFDGYRLKGNYRVDEQGVVASPLILVENGILKTMLMTRTPAKKITQSNGRARGQGAEISNLIITAKNGKSFVELKKQMLDECKELGLEYGIIFRDETAPYERKIRGNIDVVGFKVYVKDGREELIKGHTFPEIAARDMRRIMAAGNDSYPINLLMKSSYSGNGIPASVVAPSVLIEEIQIRQTRINKEKPRIVTDPFNDK